MVDGKIYEVSMKRYKICYRPYKFDDGTVSQRYFVMETYTIFGKELWRHSKVTEYGFGDIYTHAVCFDTEKQAVEFIKRLKTPAPAEWEKEI